MLRAELCDVRGMCFLLTASIYFALRCRTVGLGLHNNSEGDSSMYVHYTDTACILLMPVAQLTVHVQHISAL